MTDHAARAREIEQIFFDWSNSSRSEPDESVVEWGERVTEPIERIVRTVEAEALEKAAKDWPTMDLAIATALQPAPSNKPRAQPPSNVVTWLRQRAAAIRALKEK